MVFHAAAALFALYMLFRHGPHALRVIRARRGEDRAGALLPLVNVALALVILVMAVKGLATRLISR